MTPPRPRRGHAALGARWFTAGLAVAGTAGITSYLEVEAALSPTSPADVAESPATTLVPPPAPPDVRVIVVPDATATAPSVPPSTVPPTIPPTVPANVPANVPATAPATAPPTAPATAPPTVPPAPRRTTHATTRGSNG